MAGAQQLLAALHALYHQEGTDIKEQASRFLEQWQQTVEAWSVSDAMLHDPNATMEAQYFCAQTLRTKVQRDFEELPAEAVDSLRDSLLVLLLKYAKGPPPVRTQLCLALVALTVHVPSERWALPAGVTASDTLAGGGAVTWFAVQLQRAPADVALPCLLELLTVLPQEVNSMKYAVRPERRRQHTLELRAATSAAINVLTSCLAPTNNSGAAGGARQQPKILEAFGGWLRLSEGTALGPEGSQLSSHPLVAASLEGLRSNSELFHAAADAVSELVWCTVEQSTGAIDPGMMPLIQALVPAVMGLRPRFAVVAQRAVEELAEEEGGKANHRPTSHPPTTDEFDDDEHTAKGMARLFAEVGEAYVNLIATAVQEVQVPVEALLEVAAHPDHSLASMSYNFWHRLARNLSSGWGPKTHAISRPGSSMDITLQATPEGQAASAEQQRRRAFFVPAFERLVTIVRGKVKYPLACSSWGKEAFADFRKHRYEIADSLEDCAGVLGFERCLALLVEPLVQLSAQQQQGKPFDWRTADAALFCVRSIGPHAYDQPPGQPAQLSQLLLALPTLPRAHHLLLNCCCYTIASYCGWMNSSLTAAAASGNTQASAMLTTLLQFAFSCLEVPEASGGACSAILDMCTYCSQHIVGCMQPLTQLYTRLQGAGAGSQLARALGGGVAGTPVVLEDDVQRVMQAVCVAACKSLPSDQVPAAAEELMRPVLSAVEAVVQQLPAVPALTTPATTAGALSSSPLATQHPYLCPLLDRLGVLFAYINDRRAVANMLGKCWGVLDVVFTRCVGDGRIMERACRTLRLAVKGAGSEGVTLLPALLPALAGRFRVSRHSAFLYILSELIKIHGHDEAAVSSMSQVLTALLIEACVNLTTLGQVQQDPEMVDDVFLLAARALSYSPHLLLVTAPLPGATTPHAALCTLLDTALFGVLMQHREACCSVLSFLSRLMNLGRGEGVPGLAEVLQSVVLPRAPTLTRLLVAGVVGVLPTARLGDVAGLLSAMLRSWGQQALGWLSAAVAALPAAVVPEEDKNTFLGAANVLALLQQSGGEAIPRDERMFEGAVDDFADLCRRNPRVRQACQQSLLPPELVAAIVM